MFYFTVVLKVEFLPLIGAEIEKFSKHCQSALEGTEATRNSALKITRIQLRKMQDFKSRCYDDYRSSLVQQYLQTLRSLLNKFSPSPPSTSQPQQPPLIKQLMPDIEVQSSTTQLQIARTHKQSPTPQKNRSQDQPSKTSTKMESNSVTNLTGVVGKKRDKEVVNVKPQGQTKVVVTLKVVEGGQRIEIGTKISPPKGMVKVDSKVAAGQKVNTALKSPKPSVNLAANLTSPKNSFKASNNMNSPKRKPLTKEQYIQYLSSSVEKK